MRIVHDDTLNDCITRGKDYIESVKYATDKIEFYEYAGNDPDNWDAYIYIPAGVGMPKTDYSYIGTMSKNGDGFQNQLKLKRFKRFEGIGK